MADRQPTEHETDVQIRPTSIPNYSTSPRRRICALYMRVSTRNHGQSTDTQAIALREYAERRGFDVVEYRDEGISGAKDRRPALDRLMADARKRCFDAVLVLRFDRFARSTKHLVLALEEFSGLGIDFISLNESIDTSSPMGRMVFTVIAAVAELERSIIKERVQAGVDRARKQGKPFGRPRAVFDREQARTMAQTMSVRAIAKQLGVSKSLIARALQK